ncbi:MAG: hypothetical protein J3R72DRAFT_186725 [Linnemannia gamsii]|nr:MAG: hypothetical protein J3R72DRAFT_186725 [Linnemannia gamsii]
MIHAFHTRHSPWLLATWVKLLLTHTQSLPRTLSGNPRVPFSLPHPSKQLSHAFLCFNCSMCPCSFCHFFHRFSPPFLSISIPVKVSSIHDP